MDSNQKYDIWKNGKYLIIFSILFLGFTLPGCSVKTALLVKVANNPSPLIGEATASLSEGTFMVENTAGLKCNGTYDQWETSSLLKVRVNCNDGRYGNVTIIRSGDNKQNGSGEGTLNDGTTFKIYMGDLATSEFGQNLSRLQKSR